MLQERNHQKKKTERQGKKKGPYTCDPAHGRKFSGG